MEKLIYFAYATIPLAGIVVGFFGGAVAHLLGFPFWPSALILGGGAVLFQAGKISTL